MAHSTVIDEELNLCSTELLRTRYISMMGVYRREESILVGQ